MKSGGGFSLTPILTAFRQDGLPSPAGRGHYVSFLLTTKIIYANSVYVNVGLGENCIKQTCLTAVQKSDILHGKRGSHARDKINHPPVT